MSEYKFNENDAAHEALSVDCKVCGVPAGEKCIIPVGHRRTYHTTRYINAYRTKAGGK